MAKTESNNDSGFVAEIRPAPRAGTMMRSLPVVAGIVLALLGLWLIKASTSSKIDKVRTELNKPKTCVLITKSKLARGSALKAIDLDWTEVIKEQQPTGTIKFDNPKASSENQRRYENQVAMLIGIKVRRDIEKNEILHETDFEVELGDSLGQIVRTGFRAFAIEVSRNSMLGGLLLPNDRVDVLATYSPEAFVIDANSASFRRGGEYTSVILDNVPVVAVGGRLARAGGGDVRSSGSTIVLELTPDQALLLTQAQKKATFSLLLRSAADATSDYPKRVVGEQEIYSVLEKGFQKTTKTVNPDKK